MTQRPNDAAPDRSQGKAREEPGESDLGLTAEDVAAYLHRHPDFFADYPDLLGILRPPAAENGERVVNLQLFMVERLRAQLAEVHRAHDQLVAIGRANMAVQARIHRAVLALQSARSFEHLIETVTTDLAVILDLDAVALGVEQSAGELPPVRLGGLVQIEPGTVNELIGRGRTVSLAKANGSQNVLFGAAAGLVRSHALIRLSISQKTPPALLALGSRRAEQFQEGQRTDLLTFLARSLERCIRTWLNLPE